MCVMKRAVLLLLLAAAMGGEATPDDCDGLNKTLPTADVNKVSGDWVLVWGVADNPIGEGFMVNLSSSQVELRLLPDNSTISYNEWNLFQDKECTKYILNMTVPSDLGVSGRLYGTVERHGVVIPYNESSEVSFFESCADCLTFIYKGDYGRFLLTYKSLGHHQDVEQMKAAHDDHNKLAECLGMPHDKPFIYDGAADLCGQKSEQS